MARTPAPKSGCYTSSYPGTQRQEVRCTTAPTRPYPPATGATPENVGEATGFYANVPGSLSSVVGSFYSVTGVSSESDPSSNNFALQLNTNTFRTALCKGQVGCFAWQQYIYSNSGSCIGPTTSCVFIQYWLVNYQSPCPTCPKCPTSPTTAGNSWTYFSGGHGTSPGCYINGKAAPVPDQTITELAALILTGSSQASAQSAVLETSAGAGTLYNAADPGDLLAIGANWTAAEFNVFGDCCQKVATFNSGSAIVVQIDLNLASGAAALPTCGPDYPSSALNRILFTESYYAYYAGEKAAPRRGSALDARLCDWVDVGSEQRSLRDTGRESSLLWFRRNFLPAAQ